jgi:hypothetical protein
MISSEARSVPPRWQGEDLGLVDLVFGHDLGWIAWGLFREFLSWIPFESLGLTRDAVGCVNRRVFGRCFVLDRGN